MEDTRKLIAENIARLRKKAGMTQADLAEKINYTDKAVSKWERGESLPDIIVLKEIADLLGVTVDTLISEEGKHIDISSNAEMIKHNRRVITLMSIIGVWAIATAAFAIIWVVTDSHKMQWLAFVIAVPVSLIVWLVLNSLWGIRKNNFYLISGILWSILLNIWLLFLQTKMLMLFIIGVPAQIVIFLAFRFKTKKPTK